MKQKVSILRKGRWGLHNRGGFFVYLYQRRFYGMEKKGTYGIFGFLFVGALGTLFHFVYEWSGNFAPLGLFFPINESIWEHLKLLYFPVLLWWFIDGRLRKGKHRVFASRMWALNLALCFIPVAHYTYSGILGRRLDWVDIGLFFVADALYFVLAERFISKKKEEDEGENILAVIAFFLWMFAFFLFTFLTPSLALFQNP